MTSETAQSVAKEIAGFGLTQAQAAEKIGIAQPTFRRILRGDNDTKSAVFQKMKKVLQELKEGAA